MQPVSVSEVAKIIKDTIKNQPELIDIAVRGEVTNYAARAHHYFSIKDEKATLKCVIWSSRASKMDVLPLENGTKVVLMGSITTYPMGSIYQLDVYDCIIEGKGDLYKKFLEMKEMLLKEGLFAVERKQTIPVFPEWVGIVTSEKGAALQDMLRVFMEGPGLEIVVVDARVQGEGAAATIAQGLNSLNGKVDVIIIGRGGGSIEELWAFNEEELARAVFACETPVISAVGHEVDEVISDFVADVKVSTPTAAAELIIQTMEKLIEGYGLLTEAMHNIMEERLNSARQTLDLYDMDLRRRMVESRLGMSKTELRRIEERLTFHTLNRVALIRESIATLNTALRTTWIAGIEESGLAALYQDGKRIREAATFSKGGFEGQLRDGKIKGEVKEIEV